MNSSDLLTRISNSKYTVIFAWVFIALLTPVLCFALFMSFHEKGDTRETYQIIASLTVTAILLNGLGIFLMREMKSHSHHDEHFLI